MTPSINHSYLCKKLIVAIEQSDQWEAWPELSLDVGHGLIPDIAVYKKGQLKPNFTKDKTKCDLLPILAIEVISPSQSVYELMEKAEKMLNAGIQAIWTIEPYGQLVYISTTQGLQVELAKVIETVGIRVDFKQIFS